MKIDALPDRAVESFAANRDEQLARGQAPFPDAAARGLDDARGDHQPFNWQGQRVEPYFDNDRGAWGFWFLGLWIPL